MTARELDIIVVDQLDERLGRHIVHDPASRGFPFIPRQAGPTDPLRQRSWRHRVYGPRQIPNQPIGCCTGVDQCVKADAAGNRRSGVVLGMPDAIAVYSKATTLDDIPGEYPGKDTGSSGLAACKAAAAMGIIDRYEWIFGGAAGVLQALWERPVGVGTYWYQPMFYPDAKTQLVHPGGTVAGGHQWSVIGFNAKLQAFEGMCWWGPTFGRNGLFRIGYDALDVLLADHGDAHVTYRKLS